MSLDWNNLLAGKTVRIAVDRPIPGYFRYRAGGPWRRVAIWNDGGRLVAIDNDETVDPLAIWAKVAAGKTETMAVTYEAYLAHERNGSFADERDHNQPPELVETESEPAAVDESDEAEIIGAEADRLFVRVNETLKEGKSADIDAAGRLAKELVEVAAKAEAAHDVEKAPWLAGGRIVDDRWSFSKTLREAAADLKRNVITPILAAMKAEQDRIAREAAEADRKEREAAFLASRPKPGEVAPPAPAFVPPPAPKAGKIALKEVEVATVTDPKALAGYLIDQQDDKIADLLQKAASRLLKAGVRNAPGVTISKEAVAK